MPAGTDIDIIIANAIATANTATENATTQAGEISDAIDGFFSITAGPSFDNYEAAVEPAGWDASNNSLLTYNAYATDVIGKLSNQLAYYFQTYYPLDADAFEAAQAWILNVIENGGTGIPSAVENALWQRGRDRLIVDGKSASAQVLDSGAVSGRPLVSGAVVSSLKDIQLKRIQETGQMSTGIAVKQAEIEIETIKFAVGKALETRLAAMNAAADYIRAIAGGLGTAVDIANLEGDKRAEMMTAIATLYRARLSRDELIMNKDEYRNKIKHDSFFKLIDNHHTNIDEKIKAATNAADVYAKVAQAALASLSAISGQSTSAFE